jgi:hypothetical protein
MKRALVVGLGCFFVGCTSDAVDDAATAVDQADIEARAAGITVPFSVEFGRVQCDSPDWSERLPIQNGRNEPVTFDAHVAFGNAFDVSPTRGTIPARGRIDLRVTPRRPIGTFYTPPGEYRETLTIRTSAPGDVAHRVELRRTVDGAVIDFGPGSLSFNAPPGQTRDNYLTFTNDGTSVATLYLNVQPPFAADRSSVTLFGHDRQFVRITYTGGQPGSSASSHLSVNAPFVCNRPDQGVYLYGSTSF